MAGLSLCASSAFVDCGAETLPRNEERSAASSYLPEAFADDPDRLARFQREAQVLASLNHPNIAAIYGLEEADGTRALVLELVEGPTLADRIAKGPIPLDEALPIAKQIAEALEAAHEAGVIHRDLKPANIKVRDDGTVKVLDFGLAKALDPNPSGAPSQSPTLTAAATQMGVIMGTAAYMSPEQARGKPVNKRADIWSFGCVLYEMLTGQMAFQGEDVSLTLASVLNREPQWDGLPHALSPALDTFLRRCLEKEPRQRVQAIGDVRLAMEGAFETTVSQPSAAVDVRNLQVWQRPVPALVALALASLTGLVGWALTRPEPLTPRVERFAIPPPAGETVGVSQTQDLAISPDGSRLVYLGTGGNPYQFYVRSVDALAATPLQGLDTDVFMPFVSPDGAWVGFYDFRDNALKKVSILGGPPVTICNPDTPPVGATWAEDDTIIFGTLGASGLWRVSANGGDPEELTTPDAAQVPLNHAWPHVLPGGRAVLFTILTGETTAAVSEQRETAATAQIGVLNLETHEQRVLISGGSAPHYSPTGHIVYGVSGTLRAVGFDLDRLEVTNPNPVPVLDGVVTKPTGAASFDLARDGSLVYVSGTGGSQATRSLVWVDREGREEALDAEAGSYTTVRVSPDGGRLALDRGGDVWTYDTTRGTFNRVTTDPAADYGPIWTMDGSRLVFGSRREGSDELFWTLADGTGTPERVASPEGNVVLIQPEAVTPDGTTLLFDEVSAGSGISVSIGIVSLERDATADLLIADEFITAAPAVSPDGRWIAYHSDLSGQLEVYVERFPDLGNRQPISTNGGAVPRWSPDGTELFYQSLDGRQLLAVSIVTEPRFTTGVPEVLFEGAYLPPSGQNRSYDLTPDGGRFVMIKASDATSDADESPQIILVQNWFEELKRLVPTE